MVNGKAYFSAMGAWASEMGFFDDVPHGIMKKVDLECEAFNFYDDLDEDGLNLRFEVEGEEFTFSTTYNGSSPFAMSMCSIEWIYVCDECAEEFECYDKCDKCCNSDDEENEWEVWFDGGEEVKSFNTKEEMKKMFDLYVSDMKEFGCITIEAPITRPNKIDCYGDDEVEDWCWDDEPAPAPAKMRKKKVRFTIIDHPSTP